MIYNINTILLSTQIKIFLDWEYQECHMPYPIQYWGARSLMVENVDTVHIN